MTDAHRNAKLYEHDGLRLSIPEWAARIGITRAAIYRRLKKGWSFAEAVTIPHRDRTTDRLLIQQAAAETGIRVATIGDRLRAGWSLNQALTTKPGRQGPKKRKRSHVQPRR